MLVLIYLSVCVDMCHWNMSKGPGQGHRNCEKHILVDNSGKIHRGNVKLVPKYS